MITVVMCDVMLIMLCETMGCLSQQTWGICWITSSSCCEVHTVHLFIKHNGCVQYAYLSNSSYIYHTYLNARQGFFLHFILKYVRLS